MRLLWLCLSLSYVAGQFPLPNLNVSLVEQNKDNNNVIAVNDKAAAKMWKNRNEKKQKILDQKALDNLKFLERRRLMRRPLPGRKRNQPIQRQINSKSGKNRPNKQKNPRRLIKLDQRKRPRVQQRKRKKITTTRKTSKTTRQFLINFKKARRATTTETPKFTIYRPPTKPISNKQKYGLVRLADKFVPGNMKNSDKFLFLKQNKV